jgi:hypothetical protein
VSGREKTYEGAGKVNCLQLARASPSFRPPVRCALGPPLAPFLAGGAHAAPAPLTCLRAAPPHTLSRARRQTRSASPLEATRVPFRSTTLRPSLCPPGGGRRVLFNRGRAALSPALLSSARRSPFASTPASSTTKQARAASLDLYCSFPVPLSCRQPDVGRPRAHPAGSRVASTPLLLSCRQPDVGRPRAHLAGSRVEYGAGTEEPEVVNHIASHRSATIARTESVVDRVGGSAGRLVDSGQRQLGQLWVSLRSPALGRYCPEQKLGFRRAGGACMRRVALRCVKLSVRIFHVRAGRRARAVAGARARC